MTARDDLATLAAPHAELSDEQRGQFGAYRRLLVEWNGRFNLTAVKDPAEIDRRLFLDALRMVPPVRELGVPAPGRAGGEVAAAVRLVDVGTGAGFPGLALKVALPALDVTLVEATGKKVRFLEAVIGELGLRGVSAVHGRAEELARQPGWRGAFDVCTARGVSSLPALLELAAPLLRLGGVGLFPKGMEIGDELAAGRRAAPLLGVAVASAEPIAGSETRLVVARKVAETPEEYPRRAGLPAREPLGAVRAPARPAAARPTGRG